MDGREQAIIDIAKTIAWHHRDRKNQVFYNSHTEDGRRSANDYYADKEYKTFMPAARGVLALIEGWSEHADDKHVNPPDIGG